MNYLENKLDNQDFEEKAKTKMLEKLNYNGRRFIKHKIFEGENFDFMKLKSEQISIILSLQNFLEYDSVKGWKIKGKKKGGGKLNSEKIKKLLQI